MKPKEIKIAWGDYRDRSKAGKDRTVVESLLLSKYSQAFLMGLDTIRRRCNPNESITVHWWYAPFIYVEVVDPRYGEYPTSLRLLVSFDLTNGLWSSLRSENQYECSRRGWRNFAERFIGRKPTYYKSGAKFAPVKAAA